MAAMTPAPASEQTRGLSAMIYICGECHSENEIRPKDPIRCRECGYRILYKKRCRKLMTNVLLTLFWKNYNNFSKTGFVLKNDTANAAALGRAKSNVKLVPLKSISEEDLGVSILHLKENGSGETNHDYHRKIIKRAKIISLSSSALGAAVIPIFTAKLTSNTDNLGVVAFAIMCDIFIGLFTFTPLLLHFLTKRYVVNLYYNKGSQTFTTVHYNFFFQKRALRFKQEDVNDVYADLNNKKVLASLATIIVHGYHIMLPLNIAAYRDEEAFKLLTKNVHIPEGHD
uniref:Uncharacterized protein n=1 Tax=Acrobeloides nanus TaxID=290746 RepID=A0A914BVT1_9BILA